LVSTYLSEHHLAGRAADVAYPGRGYEYAIDLPGHGRLTGVFVPVGANRGESVGLRLDPERCHVFGAGSEPPTRAGRGHTRRRASGSPGGALAVAH
jgi:hypothetical protein